MQTRLSVCNQVLFLTLEKGFSRKPQALLRGLSAHPAVCPKALLTAWPPQSQGLLSSAPLPQGNRPHILKETWTTLHHTPAHGNLYGQLSHLPSPRVLLQAGVCTQGTPPAPWERSPMLIHEGYI